jgi:hypothetical protein
LGGSAAGQPPLTAGARLVCQAVVREDGLFAGCRQLAVGADRGSVFQQSAPPQEQHDQYDDSDQNYRANADINGSSFL